MTSHLANRSRVGITRFFSMGLLILSSACVTDAVEQAEPGQPNMNQGTGGSAPVAPPPGSNPSPQGCEKKSAWTAHEVGFDGPSALVSLLNQLNDEVIQEPFALASHVEQGCHWRVRVGASEHTAGGQRFLGDPPTSAPIKLTERSFWTTAPQSDAVVKITDADGVVHLLELRELTARSDFAGVDCSELTGGEVRGVLTPAALDSVIATQAGKHALNDVLAGEPEVVGGGWAIRIFFAAKRAQLE